MSISVDLTPNRTTGIAPLHVFFDASATTSTVSTVRPFHDLHFVWDFGDTVAGTWTYSGRSKNQAFGGVAGHVYETAGTYTTTLRVQDTDGTTSTTTVNIIVYDADTQFPTTTTYCFSTSGNFTGAPTGSTNVTTSSWATIAGYIAAGRRLLLRAGETWSTSATATINNTGPGIFGKFGSGADPVINVTANVPAFTMSSTNPNCQDWRLMDLNIIGNNDHSWGIYFNGTANNISLIRCHVSYCYTSVEAALSILNWWNANGSPGHTVHDGTCYYDCNFEYMCGTEAAGGCGVYSIGRRFSVLGVRGYDTMNAQHVLRFPLFQRGVIQHCYLDRAQTGRHLLKLHSNTDTAGLGYGQFTELFIISDNLFQGTGEDWPVCPGSQNPDRNETVCNCVIERNHFKAGSGSQRLLVCYTYETTVRNNIFDLTGATSAGAMMFSRRGAEPVPHDIRIYNNTMWYPGGNNFIMAQVDSIVDIVTMRNNLGYAPSAANRWLVYGSPTNLTQSNNQYFTNPQFATSPPSVIADYDLQIGSPAIDAGYTLTNVYTDYNLGLRVPAYDVGAIEHGSTPGEGGGAPPEDPTTIVFGVTV
jgi:hypothetical protein